MFLLTAEATVTKQFNRTSPPATVVQSGYQGMFLALLHLRQKSLGHFEAVYWLALCVGGNNGYYVPNKIHAAAAASLSLSLHKDLSPYAMIASSQSAFLSTDIADRYRTDSYEMING